MNWGAQVSDFIELADQFGVRMIMVGGGAVNFHGYRRHSADVDFWIDTNPANLEKLIRVFEKMNYDIQAFPEDVLNREQNISVKFSPHDLNLELITRFEIGKTFDEALKESEVVHFGKAKSYKWNVLNRKDLLESKKRAGRPKDLLDIEELRRLER